MRTNRGFTRVELLVVIAIIAPANRADSVLVHDPDTFAGSVALRH